MTLLQIIWFWLLIALAAGYVVLDGYDLGTGFWYIFARNKDDRAAMLNSITPFWDGNEVWLVTAGGALFAAFPAVYATVFSTFYLPFILILFALIARASSIVMREQGYSERWNRFWNFAFCFGSLLPAILFGVAAGNLLKGLEIDAKGNFTGSVIDLLNPYSLLIGFTNLALMAVHGALWIKLKTLDELSIKALKWARISYIVFVLLLSVSIIETIKNIPGILDNYITLPAYMIFPAIFLTAIIFEGLMIFLKSKMDKLLFAISSIKIIALFGTLGASAFPTLVPSLNNAQNTLTAANSSSSPLTLKIMFIITAIFLPIVISYTYYVHKLFGGKVTPEDAHY